MELNMSEPIKPEDIVNLKEKVIPDAVFAVFNALIVENWNGYNATFRQKVAAELIATKLDTTISELYDKHYLDVEDIYRKAGWIVKYDKPAYCESYPATFSFSKGKK